MERTAELDIHWQGQFWCLTCHLYTGCPENHVYHYLEALPFVSWQFGGRVYYIDPAGKDLWHGRHGREILFKGQMIQ